MRTFLLAGVAVIALSVAPAYAQQPVIDVAAIQRLVIQIQYLEQQLQVAMQTYQQAVGILNSVRGLANANTWATALMNPGLQNPLPYQAGAFPGYVGGLTDPSRYAYGNQYLTQNTIPGGLPTNGTWLASEIIRAIRSISGMQATATSNLYALE